MTYLCLVSHKGKHEKVHCRHCSPLHSLRVRPETSLPAAISPKKIVTDLYLAHGGKAEPLQYPASKKLFGAYFENRLMSLFLKDQSESQGEVGKIDFDPLYAAQDFEIKDFSVVLVVQRKDSAEVAASFKNMGTSKKIVFLLSNTAQGLENKLTSSIPMGERSSEF